MSARKANLLFEFENLLSSWVDAIDELSLLVGTADEDSIDLVLQQFQSRVIKSTVGERDMVSFLATLEPKRLRMHYAFFAYCDDFLLQRYGWAGSIPEKLAQYRRAWLKLLFEQKVFGSRSAGVKLQRDIGGLAASPLLEQADIQIAHVYLRILWLGFGPAPKQNGVAQSALREKLVMAMQGSEQGKSLVATQPFGWMPPPGLIGKRLAPIGRWRMFVLYLGIGYVAVTCLSLLVITLWVSSILNE